MFEWHPLLAAVIICLVIFNTLTNLVLLKNIDVMKAQMEQFGLIVKGASTIVKSCTDILTSAAESIKEKENDQS